MLYTTRSTGPATARTTAHVRALTSSLKASPLTVADRRPAAAASVSKATARYQPGVPDRFGAPGRARHTPTVTARPPNAAAIRDASPRPADEPITRTRPGASSGRRRRTRRTQV